MFDSDRGDGDIHRWGHVGIVTDSAVCLVQIQKTVTLHKCANVFIVTDSAVCLIQILETVTERLVDGFQAMKHLFKENDPDGGYSVTQ